MEFFGDYSLDSAKNVEKNRFFERNS